MGASAWEGSCRFGGGVGLASRQGCCSGCGSGPASNAGLHWGPEGSCPSQASSSTHHLGVGEKSVRPFPLVILPRTLSVWGSLKVPSRHLFIQGTRLQCISSQTPGWLLGGNLESHTEAPTCVCVAGSPGRWTEPGSIREREEPGPWGRCSPMLPAVLRAGISCEDSPRRPCTLAR